MDQTAQIIEYQGSRNRLDRFLREHLPHIPARDIEALLETGQVLVNGRRAKKGTAIFAGNTIQIPPRSGQLEAPIQPEADLPVSVVAETADYLILDKGAGIPCHMLLASDQHTLVNYLLAHYPETAGVGGSRLTSGVAHRLDNDTSGLVIVARHDRAYDYFRAEFQAKRIKKSYIGLTSGRLPADGVIDSPLIHHPKNQRKMLPASAVPRPGKHVLPARTSYRRLTSRAEFSLAEISIATGVMHQIRVHLAALGYPIVGDRLYGGLMELAASGELQRHFLHAARLQFRPPDGSQWVDYRSTLPADFNELLAALGFPPFDVTALAGWT
jgi:23S rRNA pseudouridine1911/1915/1917 synthase